MCVMRKEQYCSGLETALERGMPLILDIFGVTFLQTGLNEPLLAQCAQWRKQGEKIYAATNMTASQFDQFWQDVSIRAAFDDFFCSSLLGVSKPDPVFFSTVATKLGEKPEDLLFFDDSGTNVDAAMRMGWEAYSYTDITDLKSIAEGFFDRQRINRRAEIEHGGRRSDDDNTPVTGNEENL
jgi:FMN phosphatase YigB (HAD superfamily)